MKFEVGKQYKNKDGDIAYITKWENGMASARIHVGENTEHEDDVIRKLEESPDSWTEMPCSSPYEAYSHSTSLGDFSKYKRK